MFGRVRDLLVDLRATRREGTLPNTIHAPTDQSRHDGRGAVVGSRASEWKRRAQSFASRASMQDERGRRVEFHRRELHAPARRRHSHGGRRDCCGVRATSVDGHGISAGTQREGYPIEKFRRCGFVCLETFAIRRARRWLPAESPRASSRPLNELFWIEERGLVLPDVLELARAGVPLHREDAERCDAMRSNCRYRSVLDS